MLLRVRFHAGFSTSERITSKIVAGWEISGVETYCLSSSKRSELYLENEEVSFGVMKEDATSASRKRWFVEKIDFTSHH